MTDNFHWHQGNIKMNLCWKVAISSGRENLTLSKTQKGNKEAAEIINYSRDVLYQQLPMRDCRWLNKRT